jgi:hypothetical protein
MYAHNLSKMLKVKFDIFLFVYRESKIKLNLHNFDFVSLAKVDFQNASAHFGRKAF